MQAGPTDAPKPQLLACPTALGGDSGVATFAKNQALAALLLLYRDVPDAALPWLNATVQAKRPAYPLRHQADEVIQ